MSGGQPLSSSLRLWSAGCAAVVRDRAGAVSAVRALCDEPLPVGPHCNISRLASVRATVDAARIFDV